MQTFPVSNSHLSAVHLAKYLSNQYSFLENCECVFIKPGINDTYIISKEVKKYVFRVYSFGWHSKLEIEEELRFLNLLKDKGISISPPILDKDKAFIQTFNAPEGTRLCIDLAYYQLQLYLIEKDVDVRAEKWANFLAGYESVVKIKAEEKRILPFIGVALYIFYLGNMCYRYENWSNFFLNETYVKQYIERRIKWYFEEVVA